jgi:long-subunit fatty acid transport protein
VVQSVDPQGTAHVSQLPLVPFHDTWNPRISIESPVTRWLTVAAGYRYRPSAVGDLSGTGNILDTDAHIVGFGLSHDFAPNAILPWTTTVGLFGQYHFFVARGVHKTAVDSVGAPQYQVSGSAYTYGLSVQADL